MVMGHFEVKISYDVDSTPPGEVVTWKFENPTKGDIERAVHEALKIEEKHLREETFNFGDISTS